VRVISAIGRWAGQEVNLPPLEARAMLADGRARPVDEPERLPTPPDPIAHRSDRVAPQVKRRHRR
jgi:hypothetical protein